MKKTKSAILYSYDDPIRSAYQAKYVTKTLTRFAPQVRLFSYQRAKTFHVGTDEVVILQADDNRRRDGLDEVRMELTARGLLAIDMNVTGRAAGHHWDHSFSAFVIVEDDVTAALRKSFAFARDVFDARDPYKHHDRLLYNVALSGCQHRTLVEKPPSSGSFTVPMRSPDPDVVAAFERPRVITREDLAGSDEQIKVVLALLRRRLKASSF